MLEEQALFNPYEIQVERHYWFMLDNQGVDIPCVIKVLGLFGEIIEGRILDTEGLSFFFSRFINEEENNEEDTGPEIRVEHITREATAVELKFLQTLIEESTQDFFSTPVPKKEIRGAGATHRTLH